MNIIIAIDGPAGSGKSTVAKKIASQLQMVYFDSGSIYRVFTLCLQQKVGNIENSIVYEKELEDCIPGIHLEFLHNDRKVFLFERDVTQSLRQEKITKDINKIANNGIYREKANALIRMFASKNNMVIDGRDVGTVLFPDTPYKFYLDASPETRAKRRYKELCEYAEKDASFQKEELRLSRITEDMKKRDFLDQNREVAPLVQAKDAIYIDTDDLSIDQVVEVFLTEISRINNKIR